MKKMKFVEMLVILICFLVPACVAAIVLHNMFKNDINDTNYIVGTIVKKHDSFDSVDNMDFVFGKKQFPIFDVIDYETAENITHSETVDAVDIRQTLSAKILHLENIPTRIYYPQTDHIVFFSGKIKGITNNEYNPEGASPSKTLYVDMDTLYLGNDYFKNDLKQAVVIVYYDEDISDHISLDIGREYYFTAYPIFNDNYKMTLGRIMMTFYMQNSDTYDVPESFYNNTIIPIPDVYDNTGKDEYAAEIMNQLGIAEYIQEIDYLKDVFTVHATKNMQLLNCISDGSMIICDGRGVRESDIGQRVCVMSKALAEKNRLKVGDRISVCLGDGCYHIGNYERGYPKIGEYSTIDYGDPVRYEIVGLYTYKNLKQYEEYSFGLNDLFVPYMSEKGGLDSENTITSYNFSFGIRRDHFSEFMNTTYNDLINNGYDVILFKKGKS